MVLGTFPSDRRPLFSDLTHVDARHTAPVAQSVIMRSKLKVLGKSRACGNRLSGHSVYEAALLEGGIGFANTIAVQRNHSCEPQTYPESYRPTNS